MDAKIVKKRFPSGKTAKNPDGTPFYHTLSGKTAKNPDGDLFFTIFV